MGEQTDEHPHKPSFPKLNAKKHTNDNIPLACFFTCTNYITYKGACQGHGKDTKKDIGWTSN